MSDVKPRRAGREAVSVEPAARAAAPAEPAPAIAAPPKTAPAALPPPPAAESVPPSAAPEADHGWNLVAEAHAAWSRGFEEIAVEVSELARTSMSAASDAAIALLGARTFAEAVEINAGLARHGVDAMIEHSAKLSEIGVKTVTQASRPVLSQLGALWKAGAA
jgi:hypothetical protein